VATSLGREHPNNGEGDWSTENALPVDAAASLDDVPGGEEVHRQGVVHTLPHALSSPTVEKLRNFKPIFFFFDIVTTHDDQRPFF
jgi:hypothetical protein